MVVDKKITADAWAGILIERWQKEIERLDIVDSRSLYNSFEKAVESSANGDVQRIELAYDFYGWFVDLGVGKGTKFGDAGDALLGSRARQPRKWIGEILSKETFKLSEIMAKKYADEGVAMISTLPGRLNLG